MGNSIINLHSLSWVYGGMFRKIRRKMFIRRLRTENPDVIDLTIDTMVMDNDEVHKREGTPPAIRTRKDFNRCRSFGRIR